MFSLNNVRQLLNNQMNFFCYFVKQMIINIICKNTQRLRTTKKKLKQKCILIKNTFKAKLFYFYYVLMYYLYLNEF